MRKVNPNSLIPSEINYSEISIDIKKISTSVIAIKDSIYKGTTKINKKNVNKVSLALKNKYKNKCGYCETYEYDPQVEHHRPKGFVTGGGKKPNGKQNDGYHWLAYEWTNMVASCARCNGRKHKGTKFPVSVKKAKRKLYYPGTPGGIIYADYRYNSLYLKSEKPQILHPEYCIPNKHLKFDNNANVIGVTDRGRISIDVYGLNNETHIANRLTIYNDFSDRFDKIILKKFRKIKPISDEVFKEFLKDIYFDIFIRANDENKNFTLFTKELYKRFQYFFIAQIPKNSIKNYVKLAFKEVLESHLK